MDKITVKFSDIFSHLSHTKANDKMFMGIPIFNCECGQSVHMIVLEYWFFELKLRCKIHYYCHDCYKEKEFKGIIHK